MANRNFADRVPFTHTGSARVPHRRSPTAMLEAALQYADNGFAVLPCGPSKAPFTRRGCLDATRDPNRIRNFWGYWRRANIGVACAASGVLVLDIDPRNAGDETLGALERAHGRLPPTWTSLTGGGGQHYWFDPGEETSWRAQLGAGIDIKYQGFVVVPPSQHASGRAYAWDLGGHPEDVNIAPVPPWVGRLGGAHAPRRTNEPAPAAPIETSYLYVAFSKMGWLGAAQHNGKMAVRCPWFADHSDGRGMGQDSSSVLLPPRMGLGAFHCSHGHCADRKTVDVLRIISPAAHDAARRASPQGYVAAVSLLAAPREEAE